LYANINIIAAPEAYGVEIMTDFAEAIRRQGQDRHKKV